MDYSMLGPAISLGLGCVGSSIGCGIAGMASHAVMSRVEDGHGKFIAMSAMPASQSLYGFILMYIMMNDIRAGTLDPFNAIGIGLFSGIVMMVSSMYQGMCAASGIQASARQPSIFGKTFAALGIVEGFSLFNFVFSLLLL
jgi:V/A-type H+-transporting ATPase subunit K